mgnify:FL=1
MDEVLCSTLLQNFIRTLLTDENSIAIAQELFEQIQDRVSLARVELKILFSPCEKDYVIGERSFSSAVFTNKNVNRISRYREAFSYGPEDRNVLFLCTSTSRDGKFSEEELSDLKIFLSIYFIHVERLCVRRGLEEAYHTQKLTGLPNQIAYSDKVFEFYDKGILDNYTAFYFNLSGFGLLNYDFDEREVDVILRRYGQTVNEVVSSDEVFAHLGGDNFVALIKKERTEFFLEFIKSVRTYGIYKGVKIPISISARVGIFQINTSIMHHPGEVIGQAGAALNYARKKRRSVVWMTPEINDEIFFDKQIYEGLTDAINNGNIKTFYQPKVNLDTGEIIGAEALARWDFNGELLSPGKFVPILEKSTRISELDFYVLKQVCKTILKRKRQGKTIVPISVNFSKRDLEVPNIAKKITEIIDKYGVERDKIIVEVTETAYSDEQEMLLSFLRNMRDDDISTSIDDFGTGYSSLSVIREYPVSEIKIDKSFIDRDELTREDEAVVGSVISMAHKLRLHVITEGVSNSNQVDFLLRMGCSSAQGFLFDRPLCYNDFEKVLDRGRYQVSWDKKRKK